MRSTYRGPDGLEIQLETAAELFEILQLKSLEYWKSGGGDSAVILEQIEGFSQMIFFMVEEGKYFLMQHPDYLSPLIDAAKGGHEPLVHYVGGEPMEIPACYVCDQKALFEILEAFTATGGLHPGYTWEDL